MTKEWIQKLQQSDDFLEKAILSDQIPAPVLHLFACDCAERATLCEAQGNRKIIAELHTALQQKRLWIDQQCDEKTLQKAVEKARTALYEYERPKYSYYSWSKTYDYNSLKHAHQSVLWALADAGIDAAENAAREARQTIVLGKGLSEKQERQWQAARLAFLLEVSQLTERYWLIYEEEWMLPISRPDELLLGVFPDW